MKRIPVKLQLLITMLSLFTGCASHSQVREVKQELYYLKEKVDSLQSQNRQVKLAAKELAANLNSLTDETRHSKAEILYELSKQQEMNEFLKGHLENFSNGKSSEYLNNKQNNSYQEDTLYSKENSDDLIAQNLFRQAQLDMAMGNLPLAAHGFLCYLNEFPGGKQAPDARYWRAEIYYQLGQYEASLLEFKNLLIEYPGNSKSASALLKLSFSYLKLGDPDNSRKYARLLLINFNFSEEARIADSLLEE